jgi:selenide, water dikinase
VLHTAAIPVLEGALECVRAGYIPGGLKANREFAECVVGYDADVSEDVRTLLFDPQTAGGLLISVASEDAVPLCSALIAEGVAAVEIGEVLPQAKPLIRVSC